MEGTGYLRPEIYDHFRVDPEDPSPSSLRDASNLVSLFLALACTAGTVVGFRQYVQSNAGTKDSQWKTLYGLIGLCAFFGSWSTSILVIDSYRIATALHQDETWSGLLISVESVGAIFGIIGSYLFLQREPNVPVRTLFLIAGIIRVGAWIAVFWCLSKVTEIELNMGDTAKTLDPNQVANLLLAVRFAGGISRGMNSQVSPALTKYVVPTDAVGWYAPFLGLLALVGYMIAPPFSAAQMQLVHIATGGLAPFAHEGTAIVAAGVWFGLLILTQKKMTKATFAEMMSKPGGLVEENSQEEPVRQLSGSDLAVTVVAAGKEEKKPSPAADGSGDRPTVLIGGALGVSFLRMLTLTGVDVSLSLVLQTQFGWSPRSIGFVTFVPMAFGIGAFMVTPYCKRTFFNNDRTPLIRIFMFNCYTGLALVLLGCVQTQWIWIVLGDALLYMSVFGAERETMGILFEHMSKQDANKVSLFLSVNQLSGQALGPPMAAGIMQSYGRASFCLVQVVEVFLMQVIYEKAVNPTLQRGRQRELLEAAQQKSGGQIIQQVLEEGKKDGITAKKDGKVGPLTEPLISEKEKDLKDKLMGA